MKRSTAVTLVLAGSAAAVGLYSCNKPRAEQYADVQACETAGKHTAAECMDAFAAAKQENDRSAPHYASLIDCASIYGPNGCEQRHVTGGSDIFVPVMLGYLMGRSLGYHPLYQGYSCNNGLIDSKGRCYSSYSGASGGGHGGWFGGSGGSSSDSGTSARGGFGATGHGFGGGE